MDSTHLIYNITKECLFDKYNNDNTDLVINCQTNNIDKKFYRKRIINLFKLLFLNQEEQKENDNLNNLPIDIKQTFDVFNLYCIDYFKTIDTNEQINKLNNNNNNNENDIINKIDNINEYNNNNIDNDNNLNNYNKMLMIHNPNKSKSSLDNFVVINKNVNSNNDLHIPQQKNINLYDPILKNKKLNNTKNVKQNDIFLQKKNIDINYEEDNQNKKSEKSKKQKKTNVKNKKKTNNKENTNKKEL